MQFILLSFMVLVMNVGCTGSEQPRLITSAEQEFMKQASCQPYFMVEGPFESADGAIKVAKTGRQFIYDCQGKKVAVRETYLPQTVAKFLAAANCKPSRIREEERLGRFYSREVRYIYTCPAGEVEVGKQDL